MMKKRKFKRSQLVRLIGQSNDSPTLTITKIIQEIEQGEGEENVIIFSYVCTYYCKKEDKYLKIQVCEEALKKAKPT